MVGGAPLLAPPLHAQLLADLLHLRLQLPLLRLQALLLRLPEAAVAPPVEPDRRRYITDNIELHFLTLQCTYCMLYVLALNVRTYCIFCTSWHLKTNKKYQALCSVSSLIFVVYGGRVNLVIVSAW